MLLPLTPVRCLKRAVELFPRKTGVVSADREFTYAEFGERCLRLAGALESLGIQKGDRVAYLSFNNHQLLEGYYGPILAGAIVMPLNVRLTPFELKGILNHSGARILLYENDFLPIVEQLRPDCPRIEQYISLEQDYERLLANAEPRSRDYMEVDENSIAEVFYTSGSTGTPKGVALTHRTLYLHALSVATICRQPESMVDLHTIPLFHANGWGHPQTATMLGAKQVMVRRFEPSAVLALIEKYRATDMALVPTMANALINAPDLKKYDLSSLRQVMIGGAASSPELIARLEAALGSPCWAGYGLSETAPVITCARPKEPSYASEEERLRRLAMAGWPIPNVEIRVVDPDNRDVPQDMQTIGEVAVRSDHVMEGYFLEAAATEAVMTGGWFHTGDMAVWDQDGYIHIVDRKKEIIISGGENISSLEVEKAIYAHPSVFECAVVAAPDEKWGEVPAAIIVRKPGAQLEAEELCEFLQGRIGKFKLPRIIEFSEDALPKTGTGKIRKLVLREKYWAGKAKRVQG